MILNLGLLIAFASASSAASSLCNPPRVDSCPQAFMPKPHPFSGNMAELLNEIKTAQRAAADEVPAREKWIELRDKVEKIADRPGLTADEKTKRLANILPDFMAATERYKPFKQATADAYNKVIADIIAGYGLTPPVTDFRNSPDFPANSPQRDKLPWAPHFSEEEIKDGKYWSGPRDKNALDAERRDMAVRYAAAGLPPGAPHGADTPFTNGGTVIFASLFTADDAPEQAAAVILHETTHWIDIIAHGSHISSFADESLTEANAYKAQADFLEMLSRDFASRGQIDKSRSVMKEAAFLRATSIAYESQARNAREHNIDNKGDPRAAHFLPIYGLSASAYGSPANVDAAVPDADPTKIAETEIAAVRKKIDEQHRDEESWAARISDVQLRQKLLEMANALCENPGAYSQEDFDALPKPSPDYAPGRGKIIASSHYFCSKTLFEAFEESQLNDGRIDLAAALDRLPHAATPLGVEAPSAAAVAQAVPEAPPQAATPSGVPLPDAYDCLHKLDDMAVRACRGVVLTQDEGVWNVLCNRSIAASRDYPISMVQQGLPECERVLLYNWFGGQNLSIFDPAAVLNATATLNAIGAKIRAQYPPPPQTNHIPDPRPIRRNPTPAPCTHMVTSETGGFSVPHPCQ